MLASRMTGGLLGFAGCPPGKWVGRL